MSLQVSDEQRHSFEQNGFLKIPAVLGGTTLSDAQDAYRRMLAKVESGQYPFLRIYDDYRKLNIAGIEHLFHPEIYEPALFQAIVSSGVLPICSQILRTEEPAMILNRIHCTTHYSHTGFWHRDAAPGEDSHLQLALHLFDEKALWTVPGSHVRPDTPAENDAIRRQVRARLPEQNHLGSKAGDLLLFNSAIIHRAASAGFRAHVHFRFGNKPEHRKIAEHKKEWFNRPEVLELCDPAWHKMLTETMTDGSDNTMSSRDTRSFSLKARFNRLRNTLMHHALFPFPEDSIVFQRSYTGAPNLRLQKLFGLEWK